MLHYPNVEHLWGKFRLKGYNGKFKPSFPGLHLPNFLLLKWGTTSLFAWAP